MAFVLAAVAGAGALVAGWWRWRSGQEDGEGEGGGAAAGGPVSDDAYWGFDGAGEEAPAPAAPSAYGGLPVMSPGGGGAYGAAAYGAGAGLGANAFVQPQQLVAAHVVQQQMQQEAAQNYAYGPPPPAAPPPAAPPQGSEVEQLRAANQQLSQQLAEERQRSATLSHSASAQEATLRQHVLELNARLLDAEDERAVEREQLAAQLAQAEEEKKLAAASAAAEAVDGPQHEGEGVATPASPAPAAPASYEIDPADLTLGDKLGEGAFGAVFKGVWRGGEVAVKKLHCSGSQLTEEYLEEFRAEVQTLSALRHPNILLFMGATTRSNTGLESLSIVSEYLSGGSLWDFLHSPAASYSWETAVLMACDVAKGVNHLHSEGIIHRDLKSANLLIDRGGMLKVADFGLARVKAQTLTMTGQCGTVQWMAPEVLASQRYAEPADVYSFGIVRTRQCKFSSLEMVSSDEAGGAGYAGAVGDSDAAVPVRGDAADPGRDGRAARAQEARPLPRPRCARPPTAGRVAQTCPVACGVARCGRC